MVLLCWWLVWWNSSHLQGCQSCTEWCEICPVRGNSRMDERSSSLEMAHKVESHSRRTHCEERNTVELVISLPIKGWTIPESIVEFYKTEIVEKRCEKCGHQFSQVEKNMSVVQLKRFTFSATENRVQKIQSKASFALIRQFLWIGKFCHSSWYRRSWSLHCHCVG